MYGDISLLMNPIDSPHISQEKHHVASRLQNPATFPTQSSRYGQATDVAASVLGEQRYVSRIRLHPGRINQYQSQITSEQQDGVAFPTQRSRLLAGYVAGYIGARGAALRITATLSTPDSYTKQKPFPQSPKGSFDRREKTHFNR